MSCSAKNEGSPYLIVYESGNSYSILWQHSVLNAQVYGGVSLYELF